MFTPFTDTVTALSKGHILSKFLRMYIVFLYHTLSLIEPQHWHILSQHTGVVSVHSLIGEVRISTRVRVSVMIWIGFSTRVKVRFRVMVRLILWLSNKFMFILRVRKI